MIATYEVPQWNLDDLRKQVEQISRKATKLGASPITLAVSEAPIRLQPMKTDGGTEWVLPYFQVTIEGDTPKLAGWNLIAKIEYIENEVIIASVPGTPDVPQMYRTRGAVCDHCNASRQRKDTFLVQNEQTGEIKQVGRQCIADFLGGVDPHMVARLAEFWAQIAASCADPDDLGRGSYTPTTFSLDHYLAVSALVIRAAGWTSRGAAKQYDGLVATASWATMLCLGQTPWNKSEWRLWTSKYGETQPTEADVAAAQAARVWVESLDAGESDYLQNLQAVERLGFVDGRTMGLAASMISSHQREVGKLEARKRESEAGKTSTWQGAVGDRIERVVTLVGKTNIENDFGGCTLLRMVDANGNVYVTFASGSFGYGWEINTPAKVRGTVKRLDERNGVQQTVLTRCQQRNG